MPIRVDCRGLDCPQPVLKTKDLIQEHPQELIEVLVDNEAARINVSRFLESQGWEVSTKETEDGFLISGAPNSCAMAFEDVPGSSTKRRVVVFIPSAKVGEGAEELGDRLMLNLISTLKELDGLWRVILVNSGVFLTRKGSATAEELKSLEKDGVEILACGTCLDYYGLTNQKDVGTTTNMLDIVTSLSLADKVIRI